MKPKTKRKNRQRSLYRKAELTVPFSAIECVTRLEEKIEDFREVAVQTGQGWLKKVTFKAECLKPNTYQFKITDTTDDDTPMLTIVGKLDPIDDHHTRIRYRTKVNWIFTLVSAVFGLLLLYASLFAAPPGNEYSPVCSVPLALFSILIPIISGLIPFDHMPHLNAVILTALDIPHSAPAPQPVVYTLEAIAAFMLLMLLPLAIVLWVLLQLEATPSLIMGLGMLLTAGLGVLWILSLELTDEFIRRAEAQANYDRALMICRVSRWFHPLWAIVSHGFSETYAHTLVEAARYAEAENRLIRIVSTRRLFYQGDSAATDVLCNLGTIALSKGDYAQAEDYYARVLFQTTHNRLAQLTGSATFQSLADWFLVNGEPDRALEMLEHAYPNTRWGGRPYRYRYEIIQASQAWAYAQQGDTDLARQMLAEALAPRPATNPRGEAALYYLAGRTMQQLDEPDTARGHFKTAIKLDPKGHRGIFARQALAQLDA